MSKLYFLFTACVPLLLTSCKTTPSQAPQNVAWADSIVDQSTAIMEGSNPKALIHFLDSAFATKRGLGNKALWRKYRCMVNYYEYYYQDTAARRIYVDSMLWASKNDKELHSYEYSRSLYAMAKLLQKERRFNEAFKYYYDGRQFAKGELDNCSLADFSNALGIIRYQQEHYEEAIPYLHQAYREISSCTSPSFEYAFLQRQSVLNSIALCFEKSGQNDSAVAYYNKALAFIKSQKDIHPERQNFITTARGVVEGNLGGTYLRLGRFGLAEQHLKTNIMLNDRAGFAIEDAQTAKVKLAHLYLLQGRLPDAAVLLNQLQSDLESGRGKSSYNSEIWSRWYSLKSLYLEKKGDFRNAYFYFKRYHAHRDSLDAASKGFKDIDMDQLLREQVQQHKLGILEKEAEVKTVYVYALTIFLLMAISIATISWRNAIIAAHAKILQNSQILMPNFNSMPPSNYILGIKNFHLGILRQQGVILTGLGIEDVFEDVCEPSVRIDIKSFALVGEGVHYSCPLSAVMATGEQEIFTTDRDRSDRIFNPVVIDLKPAVIQVVAKLIPTLKSIPECGANRAFRQYFGHIATDPFTQ